MKLLAGLAVLTLPVALAACASSVPTGAGAARSVSASSPMASPALASPAPLVSDSLIPPNKRMAIPSTGSTLPTGVVPPTVQPTLGPDDCGSWWHSPTASFIVPIQAKYGEALSCLKVTNGSQVGWVIATYGSPGVTGAPELGAALGVDLCPAAGDACSDGRTDHSTASWRWYPVPGHQEAKIDGVDSKGSVLQIVAEHAFYEFNPFASVPAYTQVDS